MINTLFDKSTKKTVAHVLPWVPRVVDASQWPPDYRGVIAWRMQVLTEARARPELVAVMKLHYSQFPGDFVLHWVDTYDPRRKDTKWVPFIFFPKQMEFVQFLEDLRKTGENGLVEKCRDMGATWASCAYSVALWLFVPEIAIGWGSRKEVLVDRIGDPDSIFEKMRLMINRIPSFFRPASFDASFMKLINGTNGATITGEAGDNIGRGGRKSIYFKDESAHYERPEKIEAALGDNTETQVDISSVNGLGNVFHRKREAGEIWQNGKEIESGVTRVFIFDYSDHPAKDKEWYDRRKARFEREGLAHIFAQEVDRNYSAAVQNVVIPAEWVKLAVDAHFKIKWKDERGNLRTGLPPEMLGGQEIAAFDVADEGGDKNALTRRRGILWHYADHWGGADTGTSTRRVVTSLQGTGGVVSVMYDCIGVGAGVKSEYNRLIDERLVTFKDMPFVPWNAGGAVKNPFFNLIPDDEQSPLNGETFYNIKSQAWWSLRTRIYKTFKNITEGALYPIEDMISISSEIPLLQQILKELSQATMIRSSNLKMLIDKKPEGTASPNIADAAVMMYFPIDPAEGAAIVGSYGASSK